MRRPPLTASPPHLRSPKRDVRSWIVDPPGMLNETLPGTFVGAEIAHYITGAVEAEMKRRFPTAGKYIYVHDFSQAAGYTTQARRILTDWGMSRRHEADRVIIVTSLSNTMVRMGVSTATAVLRTAGMNIEVVDSLGAVIERHGLKPAGEPPAGVG